MSDTQLRTAMIAGGIYVSVVDVLGMIDDLMDSPRLPPVRSFAKDLIDILETYNES